MTASCKMMQEKSFGDWWTGVLVFYSKICKYEASFRDDASSALPPVLRAKLRFLSSAIAGTARDAEDALTASLSEHITVLQSCAVMVAITLISSTWFQRSCFSYNSRQLQRQQSNWSRKACRGEILISCSTGWSPSARAGFCSIPKVWIVVLKICARMLKAAQNVREYLGCLRR